MKHLWIAILIGLLGLIVGCEQALFPDRLPRTQYERFDRLRGNYAPPRQQGPFGEDNPSLRERLSPYNP